MVTLVLLLLASVAAAALVGVLLAAARGQRRAQRTAVLPPAAEAALHAVTEVQAHPRNVLVLKDPTSEMRLTQADRDAAAATAQAPEADRARVSA